MTGTPALSSLEDAMTTPLYYGRQPVGYEAEAIARLRRDLNAACIDAHLFANFEIDGREIDLLVVKRDGMYLVELKKVGGPVIGAVNGEWRVLNGRGEYPLHGGRDENPYQQMRTQYRVLTEYLECRKADFLAPYSANGTRFRPLNYQEREVPRVQIRSLLVFYPELPRNSQLDIEWPIEKVSFTELSTILRQPTKRVNLTDEEIVALAKALHLTLWEERSETPPPSRRESQPPHVWLPPKGMSLQHAWQHILLFVVVFLTDRLTDSRDRLLIQLQHDAPLIRVAVRSTPWLPRTRLWLTPPVQIQSVPAISE